MPIKVLRIINRFNIGGPTFNAAYLTKYLSNEFETMLVGGSIDESEDSSGFVLDKLDLSPVILSDMKRDLDFKSDREAYRKLKQIIKEFKPDIVHTHASKAGALGRLAAYRCGVPQIYHTFHGHVFHSYFGKAKTQFYLNIERYLAKKSTGIIAISEIQKNELVNQFRICPEDKCRIVKLGFDLSKFQMNREEKRAAFRSKWGIQEDEIAIGIIGRLVPIKNHDMFLRVVRKCSALTNKKMKFVIVGDGELGESLRDEVKDSQLKNVVFTSWQTEMDVVYAGLDIVALTSLNEGTPVSLIEAQASGVPIVTTDVGGVRNIVRDGETAFVSPSKDVDGFSKNLIRLIDSQELRNKFSLSGEFVLREYHYSRLVKDIEKIYLEDYAKIN